MIWSWELKLKKSWQECLHTMSGYWTDTAIHLCGLTLYDAILCRETPYDERLIQRYRKALDTAVKIATVHNVLPIRGRTVICCSLSPQMNKPCQSAKKGLGKPRTVSWLCTWLITSEHCFFQIFLWGVFILINGFIDISNDTATFILQTGLRGREEEVMMWC